MVLMVLLVSMRWATTHVMGYLFLESTRTMSSLPSLALSFFSSYLLITCSNTVFFSIQLTIQEHEDDDNDDDGDDDGDDDDDDDDDGGDGGVDTAFCTC